MPPSDHDAAALARAGLEALEQNQPAEALDLFDRAIARHPSDMELHNNRGRVLLDLGRAEEALAAFTQAASLAPDDFPPAYNIGIALNALGRKSDALTALAQVSSRWPAILAPRQQLAHFLSDLGQHAEALRLLNTLLAEFPEEASLLIDRGNVLIAMEQYAPALASFDQATAMRPGDRLGHYNKGCALQALERHADAAAAYEAALRLAPDDAASLINRANSLRRLNRHLEAIADYRRLLESQPGNAMARANLGKTLGEIGQREPALVELDAAIAADPAVPEARWMRVTTTIPLIRAAGDDLAEIRNEFATSLAAYDRWAQGAGDLPAVVNVGRPFPFYLAYQETNNRDLLAQYGAHCARVMRRWQDHAALPPPPPRRERGGALRVGIVSAHVTAHSVWLAIMRGWLQHADPARVRYHVFHLGAHRDGQTELADRLAWRFEHGVRGLRDWAAAIRAADLDALVYPEIGMDDLTVKLASQRLAPVQVAAWGHPETTGLPSIDAYVSAAALEPPGAQANYTETLVALPRLGCCYTPLPLPATPPDLAALGLRADRPIAICPGTPFKYTPEYDHVYVEIARRAPDCQLVLFRQDVNPLLSDAVYARLGQAFGAVGLDIAAHVHLIPWQNHPGFYGLMQRADLFLDTLGFSGFNTAIQAIECGLPVVTMEGRFMRGRLASGILREMDMAELVAAKPAGYADIAVRLIVDPHARTAAREKLMRNRERIFADTGAVRAFEDFLHDACRNTA